MRKLAVILALIAMMSGGEALRAQGIIAPGHVMGNSTSSQRTATDTSVIGVIAQDSESSGTAAQALSNLGGLAGVLPSADIFVGNSSNVAAGVPMSGDCLIDNTGAVTCTKTNGTAFGALATLTPGTDVSTILTSPANSNGGVPSLNGSFTIGDCLEWSSSGIQDAGAACGSGSGTNAPPQDFVAANGDFTPGVTTTLTLTNPPSSANGLAIFFDGMNQSFNTWSLSGSVVTFLHPITAQYVVEARSVVGGSGALVSGSLVNGNLVSGAGTSVVKDSGIAANSVVSGSGTSVAGDLAKLNNTTTTGIADSGISIGNVPTGYFLAGPATGGPGAALMRPLAPSDIPYTIPAKCDGSTDDATTINAFLTALGASGGGTATLPAGICIIGVAETISVPNYVILKGQGSATFVPGSSTSLHQQTTLLWSGGITAASAVDMGADARSNGLEDLTIDGDETVTTSTFEQGVYLHGSIYGTYRNVAVQNIGDGWFLGADGTSAQDNNAWNNFYDIKANNISYGIVLAGNGASSSTSQTTDNFFYDAKIFAPLSVGILFEEYCDSNTFIGGYLSAGLNNAGTQLSGVIGIELNDSSPTNQVDVYGENFYGYVMDIYSTASDVNHSIVVNDTGVSPGDGTSNIYSGEIGQASTGAVVPIVQNGGSMVFQLTLGSGPTGFTAVTSSGSPTSSNKSILGLTVVR